MTETLTLRRPDDWHMHLRDGAMLKAVANHTAPHPRPDKETACGCAGIFSAPVALECCAATFEAEGALDRLEAFASLNGPRF